MPRGAEAQAEGARAGGAETAPQGRSRSGAGALPSRLPALLLACALFLVLALPFVSYRTDDTFIFLRYARNLAHGHGLAFNPGEPVYGFTSVAWVVLLAPAFALAIPPLAYAKGVACLLALAAVWGFWVWAGKRLSPTAAGAATVALAANAWLVRWSASAMETALAVALVTWGLARSAIEADDARRRPIAALLFALGVLARPELGLLLALTLAADLARGRIRRAAVGAGLAALVIAPWFGYAQATFGHVVPDTAAAKGRLLLAGLDPDPLRDVAKAVAATSGLEAILCLAAGIVLIAWQERMARPRLLAHAVPILWLLGLPIAYLLTGFDVLSRYVLPVIPVVVLYGFRALEWAASRRIGSSPAFPQHAVRVLAALVVAQNIGVLARVVYPHTERFSRGVEDCLGGLGRYCAAHTPPGSRVAIADIGAFGYYADRPVLDLAGLVSPAMLPIVNEHPIEEIAARLLYAPVARAEYLVDRSPQPERLAGEPHGVFEPLTSCWVEGLGVRAPAPIAYTLYRVHWERWPAGP